jgi:hypothetical protein
LLHCAAVFLRSASTRLRIGADLHWRITVLTKLR